jgi:hypothetical protein
MLISIYNIRSAKQSAIGFAHKFAIIRAYKPALYAADNQTNWATNNATFISAV